MCEDFLCSTLRTLITHVYTGKVSIGPGFLFWFIDDNWSCLSLCGSKISCEWCGNINLYWTWFFVLIHRWHSRGSTQAYVSSYICNTKVYILRCMFLYIGYQVLWYSKGLLRGEMGLWYVFMLEGLYDFIDHSL